MRFNEIFIFPFEKVRRDSAIIIYGMGNVGKSFYNQVATLGYCNVVATADKEADKWGVTHYNTIWPEQIKEYAYDFIVIAVASQVVAEQIKKDLINKYNVPEEKVVFVPNRRVPISLSSTDLSQWLNSVDIMKAELEQFWRERIGDITYFTNITDEICRLSAEHQDKKIEAIGTFFRDYLHDDNEIKNKIVILRLLYLTGCFDAELMQMFMHYVSKLEDFDARMWLLYDISLIEGNEQESRYADYYTDKRQLMKENATFYYDVAEVESRNETNNRVAIISFTMGNERSSHNALVVPYANEMIKQGCEVTIFPMDLFRYRYGECFVQPIVPLEQRAKEHQEIHRKLLDCKVQLHYNEGESIKERIHNLMDALIAYNPSVVYDLCGEYSFLSPLINQLFYVVALPLRGYASSSCFDIYMCRDKEICMAENAYYHSVEESQMVEALVCSQAPSAQKEYKRRDYSIPEDAFVITTVGERLKNELTPEFVDCVCAFLRENPRACWILVGEKIGSYVKSYNADLFQNRQIIEWGYERNLSGFYALCDVYWNPRRMGAGGSIASAMRCGVPIVTTTFPSDILPRLGKENAIDGDYFECKKHVEKLYCDKVFYLQRSELMKSRMQISSVTEYVQKLLEVGNIRKK